jgi:hypothetical protein
MDSEKYLKLEKAIEDGQSPSDEGPFYHHSFWEAYKGSIKGKLGGIVIGAVMGLAVATVTATALAFAGLAAGAVGTAFVTVAGAGMLYGMIEFGEIGKLVGTAAATQEQADAREAIRFGAIEKKIDALTTLVAKQTPKGKIAEAPKVDTSVETEALATYRKTHYAKLNGSTQGPLFWKVAIIGLLIGMAAGGLLAAGGIAVHIFEGMGMLAGTAKTLAPILSPLLFGAFGASFGINRDYFRKAFDLTDLWTKGIFYSKKVDELQEETGKKVEEKLNGKGHGKKEQPEVATAVAPPDGYLDYPASATFHRDRVIKASAQALQELDHTRATPH